MFNQTLRMWGFDVHNWVGMMRPFSSRQELVADLGRIEKPRWFLTLSRTARKLGKTREFESELFTGILVKIGFLGTPTLDCSTVHFQHKLE